MTLFALNSQVLLPGLMVVVLIFMFWQQKKARQQQQNLQASLTAGNAVVTRGGLHAKVVSVDEAAGTVDLDAEGVILTFEVAAIGRVIPNN